MPSRLASVVLASSFFASTALGEISLLLSVDGVNDAGGADVSVATGSWMLIADTTGDGFGPIQAGPLALGSTVGSNDLIIVRGDFTTFSTDGVISAAPSGLSFSGDWDEGDRLALVWFPDEGQAPASVEAGDAYGLYHQPAAVGNSQPWVTPADSTFDYNLELLTTDGIGFFGPGVVDPSEANADLQVQDAVVDTDGDGMPDGWETDNGLNPNDPSDAALDGDGDRKTNLEEYRAGTDPNDPASRLQMISIVDIAGDQSTFRLTWASVDDPEITYTVARSTDLASWTDIITGIPATAAVTQRDAAGAAGDAVYYRVTASR